MKKIIEVGYLPRVKDVLGEGFRKDIAELGYAVSRVDFIQLYECSGALRHEGFETIARELLTDAVTQGFSLCRTPIPKGSWGVEVWFKPGVTDVVGGSVQKAVKDMGLTGLRSVRTGSKYILHGRLRGGDAAAIARELLYNPLIQMDKIFKAK